MSSNSLLKQTFNSIAYEVISYLESLDHVEDVQFKATKGLNQQAILDWERANAPYRLPKDLQSFYQLFDGFVLNWSVKCVGRSIPTGCLRIKPLKDIMRIPLNGLDSIQLQKKYQQAHGITRGAAIESSSSSFAFAAFLLDAHPRYGKIAIILRSPPTSSRDDDGDDKDGGPAGSHDIVGEDYGVWLLKDHHHHSKAGGEEQWNHICASFQDYLRLMTIHLGIQGWQNAYAPTGLDSVTKQWMRLFCPERLMIDELVLMEGEGEKGKGKGNSRTRGEDSSRE